MTLDEHTIVDLTGRSDKQKEFMVVGDHDVTFNHVAIIDASLYRYVRPILVVAGVLQRLRSW